MLHGYICCDTPRKCVILNDLMSASRMFSSTTFPPIPLSLQQLELSKWNVRRAHVWTRAFMNLVRIRNWMNKWMYLHAKLPAIFTHTDRYYSLPVCVCLCVCVLEIFITAVNKWNFIKMAFELRVLLSVIVFVLNEILELKLKLIYEFVLNSN